MRYVFIAAFLTLGCLQEDIKPEPTLKNSEYEIIETEIQVCTFVCHFGTTAQFPGGLEAMNSYIKQNLRRTSQMCITGIVFVGFKVNTNGKKSDIEILKNIDSCPSCDNDALRLVASMPDWIPAVQNGLPVSSSFVIPIRF